MERKESIKRKKNGITLIAMVVTVIIMLLLAGIAIVSTFGENGVITKAKQTERLSKKEVFKEKFELEITEAKIKAEREQEEFSYQYLINHIQGKENPKFKILGVGEESQIYLLGEEEKYNLREIYNLVMQESNNNNNNNGQTNNPGNLQMPNSIAYRTNEIHLKINVKGETFLKNPRLIPYVKGVEGILYIADGELTDLPEDIAKSLIIPELREDEILKIEYPVIYDPTDVYIVDKNDVAEVEKILKREVDNAKARGKKAIALKSTTTYVIAFLEKGEKNVRFTALSTYYVNVYKSENMYLELVHVDNEMPYRVSANKVSAKVTAKNKTVSVRDYAGVYKPNFVEFHMLIGDPDPQLEGKQHVEISDDFLVNIEGLEAVDLEGDNLSLEKAIKIINRIPNKSIVKEVSVPSADNFDHLSNPNTKLEGFPDIRSLKIGKPSKLRVNLIKNHPNLEKLTIGSYVYKENMEITFDRDSFIHNPKLKKIEIWMRDYIIKDIPRGLFRNNPNLDASRIFRGAKIKGYRPTPEELFGRPVNITFEELYKYSEVVD